MKQARVSSQWNDPLWVPIRTQGRLVSEPFPSVAMVVYSAKVKESRLLFVFNQKTALCLKKKILCFNCIDLLSASVSVIINFA